MNYPHPWSLGTPAAGSVFLIGASRYHQASDWDIAFMARLGRVLIDAGLSGVRRHWETAGVPA